MGNCNCPKALRLVLILITISSLPQLARGADRAPVSIEVISGNHRWSDMVLPSCGFWTSRGTIWEKTYFDGARLRVRCVSARSLNVFPSYVAIFRDPGGREIIVGRCEFRQGCNDVVVSEVIDQNKAYLVSTCWETTDGRIRYQTATTSAGTAKVRLKSWFFDVANKRLILSLRTYSVENSPRSTKGCAVKQLRGKLLAERQTRFDL
jgi:hypothetical protein